MPDWGHNLYSHPEKSGLTMVAELERSSGSYEFDLYVVWAKKDGSLWFATDSGCSCPSPFDEVELADLTPLTSIPSRGDVVEDYHGKYVSAEDWAQFVASLRTAGLR